MKKFLIAGFAIVSIVIIAGMYKFNYLSHLPKHDVDGNKIKDISSILNLPNTSYVAKVSGKYYHSKNSNIDDQFFIGSMTKVFTATIIFYLEKQGLLAITDKANKYISDFPFDKDITIGDLLAHTSGIKEKEQQFMMDAYKKQSSNFSTDAVLKYAYQTSDKAYSYANTNYIILGEIIKKITHEPFEKYVHKTIINPLGLQNTCVVYKDKNCHPTKGYLNLKTLDLSSSDKYVQLDSYVSFNDIAGSAGNLVSNIDDLSVFLKALVDNRFFEFDKMIKTGKNEEYKYGIKNYDGALYGHSGMSLDSASLMVVDIGTKNVDVVLVAESSVRVDKLFLYFRDNR